MRQGSHGARIRIGSDHPCASICSSRTQSPTQKTCRHQTCRAAESTTRGKTFCLGPARYSESSATLSFSSSLSLPAIGYPGPPVSRGPGNLRRIIEAVFVRGVVPARLWRFQSMVSRGLRSSRVSSFVIFPVVFLLFFGAGFSNRVFSQEPGGKAIPTSSPPVGPSPSLALDSTAKPKWNWNRHGRTVPAAPQQFAATVNGSTDHTVTWAVAGFQNGTVDIPPALIPRRHLCPVPPRQP